MRKYKVGLIRVLTTSDPELLTLHGKLLEKYFPFFEVESRCIPNQPEGIHDDETMVVGVPKVIAMAKQMCQEGFEAVIVSCAGDPGVAEARKVVPIPVIGIEPAVKPAVQMSRTHCVGVLATAGTIASPRYQSLLTRFADGADVISVGAPGLMECVERGEFETPATLSLIRRYVEPMLKKGIDTLVLGCTHYPIVEENFHECYPQLHLINPALEQANAVKAYLTEQNALNPQKKGKFVICTSGDPQVYVNVGKRLGLFEASELKVVHI